MNVLARHHGVAGWGETGGQKASGIVGLEDDKALK